MNRAMGRGIARAVVTFLAATLVHAEPATTVRPVDLRERPATDARAVASVPANTAVDLLRREGAWVELKTGAAAGWAKLFDVRLAPATGEPPRSGAGDAFAQTLGLATGTRAPSVTTGVRGLDADMLARAQPDPRQFAMLEQYSASKDAAQTFARQGNLASRPVEPLTRTSSSRPAASTMEMPR